MDYNHLLKARDRRKEGQQIKRAVVKAIPGAVVRVKAGQGTAWGWWHISVDAPKVKACSCTYEEIGTRNTCDNCKERWRELYETAGTAVSRSGATIHKFSDDFGGRSECVNVNIELSEASNE